MKRALLALVLLSACPPSKSVEKPALKTLSIGVQQEPSSLFSPFLDSAVAEEIGRPTSHCLTQLDENYRIVPWAATTIPTLENGGVVLPGDGTMRVTWTIRDDVFWADGRPLIAQDFALGLKLYRDDALPVVDRTLADLVKSIEVLGDKRFVVVWKSPVAEYAAYRQHDAVPSHVVGPLYARVGARLADQPYVHRPLLAGAFTVESWVPGRHVILKRNPFAKGERRPYFDRLIWRFYADDAALETALVAEEIDAISPLALTMERAIDLKKRHPEIDVHVHNAFVWEHIDFHVDHPILKDVRVRRALAHGLDREKIVARFFENQQPVAHGTQAEGALGHHPAIARYPYDVDKARALLESAGWRLAEDGVRYRDGKALRLEFVTTTSNRTRMAVQLVAQSDWKKIGVDVVLKTVAAKVYFAALRKRTWPLTMYATGFDPHRLSDNMWRCKSVPRADNGWQGRNFTGFCRDDVERLFDEIRTELDAKKRATKLRQFEDIFAEELPALPLYFRAEVAASRTGLANFGKGGSMNAHRWRDRSP